MNEHPYYFGNLAVAALITIAICLALASLTWWLVEKAKWTRQQRQWDESTRVDWDDVIAQINRRA